MSIERALQLSCSKNGQKRMVRRDNPADYGDVGLARLYRDGRGRITFVTACGLRRIIVGTKLLKHM